ncbi:MAG: response regulator [Opitutales bacterium]
MTPNTPNKTISVWIIEDSSDLREELRRILDFETDMKCERTFSTAESALDALAEGPLPDALLVDIQLPGISGIEAIKKMSELYPTLNTLVLTVSEERSNVFEAICAGAKGYLLKNNEHNQIVDSVRLVHHGGSPLSGGAASMVLKAFQSMTPAEPEIDLSDREVEILNALAKGKPKKEIAYDIDLAIHTVDYHMRKVYNKLHVNSQAGAVAEALRRGLI